MKGSPLRNRSWSERWLAGEAALALVAAKVALRLVPFRLIVRWLTRRSRGEADRAPRPQAGAPGEVGWAVAAAAVRLPWQSKCLVRSVAAAAMLRRRRIPAQLSLGVRREPQAEVLEAHAWVRSDGIEVTSAGSDGGPFETLTSFAI